MRKRESPVDGSGDSEILNYLDNEEGSSGGALQLRSSHDYNRDDLCGDALQLYQNLIL